MKRKNRGNDWTEKLVYSCKACGVGNLCDVCHDHDEPRGDWHAVMCNNLTAALEPYLAALEVAREALETIADTYVLNGEAATALTRVAALLGQPGRTE